MHGTLNFQLQSTTVEVESSSFREPTFEVTAECMHDCIG